MDRSTEPAGIDDRVARPGRGSLGGRLIGTLFFAVFLLMGGVFTVMLAAEAVRQTEVWFWPEVPCTIISSGVERTGDDEQPYRPSVVFEYEAGSRTRQSRSVARSVSPSASYDRARRVADRYPAGSSTACRVSPGSPDIAVLEARLPWSSLLVFFPLIFVAIGAGGLYAVWRGASSGPSLGATRSISQKARTATNLGTKIELGIGLVFAVVGGALTLLLFVLPIARLTAAQSWLEVPATVVSSEVRSWSTDDGTSSRADVLYEYRASGRTWRSNRLSFSPLGPSGADASRTTVARYPEGAEITCYVDPDDAGRSVLDRRLRPAYLIGLLPLLFFVAGLGLTLHALGSRHRTRPPLGLELRPAADFVAVGAGSRKLEPTTGPIAKVVGMLVIAAFWNGIVALFVWQAVAAFRRGHPDWFLTVFLVPFVLVGLALIGGVVHAALAAFNPRPKLVISPAAPRLGDTLQVEWRLTGAQGRIERLTIALEGHEKATYRRGTDTVTDREVFASFQLVDLPMGSLSGPGSARVDIPEDTMHSFTSSNNAVIWTLHVHGDVPRWPDVDESFPVDVRPMARERVLP